MNILIYSITEEVYFGFETVVYVSCGAAGAVVVIGLIIGFFFWV